MLNWLFGNGRKSSNENIHPATAVVRIEFYVDKPAFGAENIWVHFGSLRNSGVAKA